MTVTKLWTLITIVWPNPNPLVTIHNTVPLMPVKWHQKKPFVAYSHCPTDSSCNICTHGCWLPCNYVTKTVDLLHMGTFSDGLAL